MPKASRKRSIVVKSEQEVTAEIIEQKVSTTVTTIEEGAVSVKKKVKKTTSVTEGDSKAEMQSLKFLGAHLSVQGGPANAIREAMSLKANAVAIFTRNQRTWNSSPLKTEDITEWHNTIKDTGFNPKMILPHGSYLINAGSPEPELLTKSRAALLDEVKRCELLGIDKYNFHPGSSKGMISLEECCDRIGESINYVLGKTKGVTIVLENTAGGGSTIGRSFEELKMIIDRVENKSRVGVCLDTCHMFASGYNVATAEGYEQTMRDFERIVGLQYLKGIHLNDSKEGLGSKKDRHENIGKGKIGLECFRKLMNDTRMNNIPLILETPATDYAKEIALLRSFEKR